MLFIIIVNIFSENDREMMIGVHGGESNAWYVKFLIQSSMVGRIDEWNY